MTSISEINLVGRVVEALSKLHSWCGETHIQKTAYVTKVIESVPFQSRFILYKHGPYSFDMNIVLNHMRSQNILSVIPQRGYGSSYKLNNDFWIPITRAARMQYDIYDGRIAFVCSQFAHKKVAELERISTAIFVKINFSNLSLLRQVSKLSELKPHIGLPEAQRAFAEAEVFFQRASHDG